MIEMSIICYDEGNRLDLVVNLPAVPNSGDIIEIYENDYEVQFRTFVLSHNKIEVVVRIQ